LLDTIDGLSGKFAAKEGADAHQYRTNARKNRSDKHKQITCSYGRLGGIRQSADFLYVLHQIFSLFAIHEL